MSPQEIHDCAGEVSRVTHWAKMRSSGEDRQLCLREPAEESHRLLDGNMLVAVSHHDQDRLCDSLDLLARQTGIIQPHRRRLLDDRLPMLLTVWMRLPQHRQQRLLERAGNGIEIDHAVIVDMEKGPRLRPDVL